MCLSSVMVRADADTRWTPLISSRARLPMSRSVAHERAHRAFDLKVTESRNNLSTEGEGVRAYADNPTHTLYQSFTRRSTRTRLARISCPRRYKISGVASAPRLMLTGRRRSLCANYLLSFRLAVAVTPINSRAFEQHTPCVRCKQITL